MKRYVVVFGFCSEVEDCGKECLGVVCHWGRTGEEATEKYRSRGLIAFSLQH